MYTVLIADDNQGWLQELSEELEAAKELDVVAKTRDGLESLRMIQEKRPDILILDYAMPGYDARKIVSEVNKMKGYNPIVYIVTAVDTGTVMRVIKSMDVDYYTIKPTKPSMILDSLRTVLDVKKPQILIDAEILAGKLDDVLHDMKIRMFYTSSKQLKTAILLYTQEGEQPLTTSLYPKVADVYGTNAKAVEKNIRTTIDNAAKANTYLFQQLFPGKRKVKNSEFIETVSRYTRRKDEKLL